MRSLLPLLPVIFSVCIILGGCFHAPTKDDIQDVTKVTAEAFGRSAVEQLAAEVKKALAEGGVSKEALLSKAEEIGQRAVDKSIDSIIDHLSEKRRKIEDEGGTVPAWIAIAIYALNELRKARRDGFLKRTPVDLNRNGIPDSEESRT